MKRSLVPLLILLCLALVGCSNRATTPPAAPTPMPAVEGTVPAVPPNGYPAPQTPGGPTSSYPAPVQPLPERLDLEEIYPLAEEAARNWDAAAYFVGVVPALQMQRNLNVPALQNGWFLKFKNPASPDEYYILFLGREISGSTVAQPILPEPLPYSEETVTLASLKVSSRAFRDQFLASEAGQAYRESENLVDFRLVDLDSTPNPVWSAIRAEDGTSLFSLDAVTGEEVADPFARYQ